MSVDKQREQLSAAIDNLNRMMKESSRNLSFAMDEVVGGPVVVVKDASSGEVIRQLPNEVVVRMAHHLADFKGKLHSSAV
jgi:flagellar protein FlaG